VGFNVPTQPKAKRVAAYARVSSGKDAMLHSLSAQVSYYSDLIQNHPGWLYCGVYAEATVIIAKANVKQIATTLSMKFILTMSNGKKVDVTRNYYYIFKESFGI